MMKETEKIVIDKEVVIGLGVFLCVLFNLLYAIGIYKTSVNEFEKIKEQDFYIEILRTQVNQIADAKKIKRYKAY